MFCSSCGASNADDAVFCSRCGAPLTQASAPPIPPPPIPSPQVQPSTEGLPPGGRNPWIAAILNLFFGIGYIYLGYKKVLGLPPVVLVVLLLVIEVVVGFFTFGLLSLFIAIFLAYDGFVKAKGQRGYLGTEPGIGYRP